MVSWSPIRILIYWEPCGYKAQGERDAMLTKELDLNLICAISRKLIVCVKKSRSRFPSVDLGSNTSVTSMEYSFM
ncbi:hypothetical protein P5673_007372 [Acropora cervicornis]|uniref:Uncharacterized protein n=1 Tax=Acropora cervicornis TaxID=6130 RepID=A0AAD9VBV7_ACRCE|nr:hypothetical protein P5673_007372 [Acropora cervicornis]